MPLPFGGLPLGSIQKETTQKIRSMTFIGDQFFVNVLKVEPKNGKRKFCEKASHFDDFWKRVSL